jgi:hypothetical protein
MAQTDVGSAEGRERGRVRTVRRDGEKVDVAGLRTEFAEGSRASQVEAFDKAGSGVIDRFQIGIDHRLNPMMQRH